MSRAANTSTATVAHGQQAMADEIADVGLLAKCTGDFVLVESSHGGRPGETWQVAVCVGGASNGARTAREGVHEDWQI